MLGGSTCPSCEMPFDKGKKRRLIDSCGHERCYTCLFRSEACPLCLRGVDLNNDDDDDDDGDDDGLEEHLGDEGFAASIFAPTDGWLDESSTVNSLCGSPRPRTKIITTRANLPSRVMHQRHGEENLSLAAMAKSLKSKPPTFPDPLTCQGRQKLQMTQSCPTPPNQRKRFFLNPKVLRSSFAPQRTSSRRTAFSPEPIANENPSALSAWMTTSWEGKANWPGVVLGKIKSLWSSSQGTANDGLNQLIGSSGKVAGRETL